MKLQCPNDMVCLRMEFHEIKAIVMTNIVYTVGENGIWMHVRHTLTHAYTHTHTHTRMYRK